jgi:hypothetical protein
MKYDECGRSVDLDLRYGHVLSLLGCMSGNSKNFDKLVHEEQARLASLHPTPNDVPGCLTLFDTFMQCYG